MPYTVTGWFHEQERAGGEPLNHERAEHDGGNDVSGTPRSGEDQRAAAYRVVGGFRCGDASTQPLPYISGVLEKRLASE